MFFATFHHILFPEGPVRTGLENFGGLVWSWRLSIDKSRSTKILSKIILTIVDREKYEDLLYRKSLLDILATSIAWIICCKSSLLLMACLLIWWKFIWVSTRLHNKIHFSWFLIAFSRTYFTANAVLYKWSIMSSS